MKYLALIYQPQNALEDVNEADYTALVERHEKLQRDSKAQGHFAGADQLEDVTTATTLSRANGELMFSDGPFSGTKEVLVGFYLFECAISIRLFS